VKPRKTCETLRPVLSPEKIAEAGVEQRLKLGVNALWKKCWVEAKGKIFKIKLRKDRPLKSFEKGVIGVRINLGIQALLRRRVN